MARRRKKRQKKKLVPVLSVLLAVALSAYLLMALAEELDFAWIPSLSDVQTDLFGGGSPANGENDCEVHFIDVGQGDCELILSGGKTVLIDAGENDQGDTVVNYLKNLGIQKIDLLIATHPHSDHIGGMDRVIDSFDIGRIVMPRLPDDLVPTTRTYTDVLTAIASKGLKITPAKVGDSYDFGPGRLTILGPAAEYDELNNTSLVCRFVYDGVSFLFTGDMESPVEKDMIKEGGASLKSDVLKVGHHGSRTSTSQKFYQAVDPACCVICVGEDNSYGHPNPETLDTIAENGAEIYRTDYHGSIVLGVCDKTLNVSTEKGNQP